MKDFKGKRIVVLTGAGVSSESGLKTFRDDNGLWEGHRVEDVATPEAFLRDPETVQRFYNLRRAQLKEVSPNRAHEALAKFETEHDGEFCLITQNVDDLHERAGSKNIIHMHGELRKARCLDSGEVFDWEGDLGLQMPHPKGGAKGRLRPHICWFGEIPFAMEQIEEHLIEADVFVAIGTSGLVYPAANFVSVVKPGCRTVLLNKDIASNQTLFDEFYQGPATVTVPQYFVF